MTSAATVAITVDFDGDGTPEVDLAQHTIEARARYGRSTPLQPFKVGLATVRLDNDDNDFTPGHPQSTYGAEVFIGRKIDITATIATQAGTANLFSGFIDDVDIVAGQAGTETVLKVSDLGRLGRRLVTGTFNANTPGDWLHGVLDHVGWAPADRSIDAGKSRFGTITFNEARFGDILVRVGASEDGRALLNHGDLAGRIVFHQRGRGADGTGLTFTDNPAAIGNTGLRYDSVGFTYGSELMANQYAMSNLFGDEVEGEDAASVALYGGRGITGTGLYCADPNHLHRAGDYKIFRFKDPALHPTRIVANAWAQTPAAARSMLNLRVGSAVALSYVPDGATTELNPELDIEGVEYIVRPDPKPDDPDTGDLITGIYSTFTSDTTDYFNLDGDLLDGIARLGP